MSSLYRNEYGGGNMARIDQEVVPLPETTSRVVGKCHCGGNIVEETRFHYEYGEVIGQPPTVAETKHYLCEKCYISYDPGVVHRFEVKPLSS